MAQEILSVAQIRQADQAAIAGGVEGLALMQRAGEAVAEAILARAQRTPVAVLCGPGSNGGDGYVVARRLLEAGWPVRVAAEAQSPAAEDAVRCREAYLGPIEPLAGAVLQAGELVVDALYGAGLGRPLAGDALRLLRSAEALGLRIVAVDLPSGLDGDRGAPLGFAPQARLTVTFHRKKPAHVLEPGRGLCGEVVLADIGLPPPVAAALFENGRPLWTTVFPHPAANGFKNRRGHLMVISGSASQSGAARLACRGALRVGAGLVTLLCPPSAVLVNAAHLEAVMLLAYRDQDGLRRAAAKAAAVVIGPAAGVGEATREAVRTLKGDKRRLVVDADALTSFMEDPDELFAILGPEDVLTPHPGEFERIFPGLLASCPERIAAARAAARRAGAVVLLKGADTAIAAPDGRCAVNTNATPFLATAGSGDVLAGLIGGLAAQGLDSFPAACAGAWIHGAAGSAFGAGLISEDLPDLVPGVLKQIYEDRNWATAQPL